MKILGFLGLVELDNFCVLGDLENSRVFYYYYYLSLLVVFFGSNSNSGNSTKPLAS